MSDMLFVLLDVFNGSDGDKTKALYAQLEQLGPVGIIAVNLFRAQKNSARAKVYHGGQPGRGSYRGMAYDRKQWAMANLCTVLKEHASPFGIRWGWKVDPLAPVNRWVLYVDLPFTNGDHRQVSFHSPARGEGPDYSDDWDGITEQSTTRILRFIAEQMGVLA